MIEHEFDAEQLPDDDSKCDVFADIFCRNYQLLIIFIII